MTRIAIICAMTFLLQACSKDEVELPELLSFTPAKGGVGNLVSLRGRSFGEDSTSVVIEINGVAALIRSFEDTMVVVEIPLGASTGKITYRIGNKSVSTEETLRILPGRWLRRNDLPGGFEPRGLGVGLATATTGYLGLGYNGGTTLKDFWSFAPGTNSWTKLNDCGLDIQGAVQMVINGKIYVGLGQAFSRTPSFHQEFWEYDPASGNWTRKADFPGAGRAGAIGIGYGNKGYAGLGDAGGGSILQDWWEYDPASDSWTRKADNPSPTVLQWPASMLINNRIFLGTSAYISTSDWFEYQPATDTWIKRANFPGRAFFAPSAFVLNNAGYLMGGGSECWQYDPASDRWTEYAFIRNILGGMAFAVNGRGFYIPGAGGGGSSNAPYLGREMWEFIP